ncbi:MAG TPA: LuxR C-terminal-related transcriptional regulator [Chryseolinea sp.]|nr:LuxR C-terminal-related transcriptional regulator [Chryseolinea sp.]
MAGNFISKHKNVLLYGTSLALLLFFLKWLELRLIIVHNSFEIYIAVVALLFTALGIWLALKLANPKVQTVVVEKEVFIEKADDFTVNQRVLDKIGLSKRELEVLQLMAQGLSNQEIASRLFLSLHTIKTHSSRIFEKMDVERRTQAIDMAKKLGIIP